MSIGPAVATATVRVIPDTTGFRAELIRQVNIATAGVTASVNATLSGAAAAAGAGTATGLGGAGGRAAGGMRAATAESNALRGSLIGLSRVTPVTVFGLGVWGTAALAAGTAIKSAMHATADFEHQLYVFQATTRATAVEMARISDEAKNLGADLSLPSTSAGDAARAMTELAKGGLSVQDTLAAARGTLQLAAAAEIEVGDAAVFVVTQLNAFGLAGTEATHVADLLAGASIAAQGDIRDFGTAFQQVSAVARQVGLTVEETTGIMVQLARAGLRGADMGTSLRTALLRLTPTTKQAQEYMNALGIQIDKNRPIGDQYASIIDQLKRSTDALNESSRTQAITQIFGQDAFRAASIAIREGSGAWKQAIDDANQLGSADRLAQANARGLSGALNGLKSNLETLGIQIGGLVSGPMEDFLVVMGNMVAAVTALADTLTGVKWPDFLGGETADKWGKNVRDALLFYPLVRRVYFPERKPTPIETPAEKKARLDAARMFGGGVGVLPGVPSLDVRAGESLNPPKSTLPPLSPAAAAAQQRRIDALNKARRKVRNADIVAPNRLQIPQLNAQLNDDLQAELKANQAVEAYFENRLKLAVEGTDRYTKILGALQNAHAATRSVQDQIDSEAKAAASEAEAKRKERKRVAEENARNAAQAAEALFRLEKSRYDLAIQRATQLQPDNIALATRAYNREIRFLDSEIVRLTKIKNKTTEIKQKIVDLNSEIVSLKAARNALKDQDKDGGFTLQDLFKATTQTFRDYASNVSSSPTTPGAATSTLFAARGAQFLAARGKLTDADKAKLEKMKETNGLLYDIYMNTLKSPRHDLPGQHTGENEYGAGYYRLPPGQRAMERARRMGGKVIAN